MKKHVLNSPRLLELKRRRRRVFLNKIILLVILVVVAFGGLSYLSGLKQLNIGDIKVVGNKVVDGDAVKKVALDKLTGKFLWTFSKTNVFIYPKNKIEKELYAKFKTIKDVKLRVNNGTILEISITERVPVYTWCGDAPKTTIETCHFMDDGGFVFAEAPYFRGEVYFKFFGSLAESYFFSEILEKVNDFKETLKKMGITATSLYVKEGGDIELYLAPKAGVANSPKIILKKDFDKEKASENLQSALDTEPLKSNFKKNYSSLLYIDIRFGNKVYYKFAE